MSLNLSRGSLSPLLIGQKTVICNSEQATKRINQLVATLDREIRLRDAARQMLSVTTCGKDHQNNIQNHIETAEHRIAEIQTQLESLQLSLSEKGGDQAASTTTTIIAEEGLVTDYKGHFMEAVPGGTVGKCDVCCQNNWSQSYLVCQQCNLCCHRQCHSFIPVTCDEVEQLATILPLYFLATSKEEVRRWIQALDMARQNWSSSKL